METNYKMNQKLVEYLALADLVDLDGDANTWKGRIVQETNDSLETVKNIADELLLKDPVNKVFFLGFLKTFSIVQLTAPDRTNQLIQNIWDTMFTLLERRFSTEKEVKKEVFLEAVSSIKQKQFFPESLAFKLNFILQDIEYPFTKKDWEKLSIYDPSLRGWLTALIDPSKKDDEIKKIASIYKDQTVSLLEMPFFLRLASLLKEKKIIEIVFSEEQKLKAFQTALQEQNKSEIEFLLKIKTPLFKPKTYSWKEEYFTFLSEVNFPIFIPLMEIQDNFSEEVVWVLSAFSKKIYPLKENVVDWMHKMVNKEKMTEEEFTQSSIFYQGLKEAKQLSDERIIEAIPISSAEKWEKFTKEAETKYQSLSNEETVLFRKWVDKIKESHKEEEQKHKRIKSLSTVESKTKEEKKTKHKRRGSFDFLKRKK